MFDGFLPGSKHPDSFVFLKEKEILSGLASIASLFLAGNIIHHNIFHRMGTGKTGNESEAHEVLK